MNKTIKIVAVLIFIVLLVACVLFVKHFTNDFSQDFAMFYVSEGKQNIFHSSTGNTFNRIYEFDVHYTFDKFVKDKSWSYTLQCTEDFVFYIDGNKHHFSELELEDVFNVTTVDNKLVVDFSQSIYSILSRSYGVSVDCINIPSAVVGGEIVTLTFYSGNGNHTVKISGIFGNLGEIFHVAPNVTEVVF